MGESNLKKSIEKMLGYVLDVAAEPVTINIDGSNQHFLPVDKCVVSSNLFRSYSCLDYGCSRCCSYVGYWNIWSPMQVEQMQQQYPDHHVSKEDAVVITINNKWYTLYVEDHTKTRCPHMLADNSCGVHQSNPIHCAFPLMKFKKVRNTTYVTREYFGRNWHLKCPARFYPMNKEGFNWTITLLKRVKALAEELNIKTHIDTIIEQTQAMWVETYQHRQVSQVCVNKVEYIGYKPQVISIGNKILKQTEEIQ